MAMKIVEDLVEGDHIMWSVNTVDTRCTVVAVLVFPPNWGAPQEVAIRVTLPSGEPYFLNATYGQELEVPGW